MTKKDNQCYANTLPRLTNCKRKGISSRPPPEVSLWAALVV